MRYKIALMLCATIAALITAEILLRIYSKISDHKDIHVKNYEYEYILHKNSLNFRDDEFTKKKGKNTIRIFIIGDSFIEGIGVNQDNTIDNLIERRCGKEGRSCEVYNLGVAAAGPSQYLGIAKQFFNYSPGLVIVSFYVDNDIENKYKNTIVNLLESTEIFKILKQNFIKAYININLNRIKNQRLDQFYKEKIMNCEINPYLLGRAAMAKEGNHKYYKTLLDRFNNDPTTKKNIIAIRDLYKNIPLVLLINPSKYQVSEHYFGELEKLGFVFNENFPVNRDLQDAIIAWAKENKIIYLDMLPDFKKYSEISFFHNIDDHYNEKGNRLVAENIYKKLVESNIFKQPN